DDRNRTEIGAIVGSGIGGIGTLVEQVNVLQTRGPDRVSPFLIPMYIVDLVAGEIAIRFGAQGPNYSVVSACSTSAHSIGEAAEGGGDDRGRLGGRHRADWRRRLRRHARAVRAQRRAGEGQPPLRRRARWIRDGRGGWHRRDRRPRPREGARRAHPRRAAGL